MINGVIFDMDGVLFDSERIYADAWVQVGNSMALPDIDTSVRNCIGRNGNDIRDYLRNTYGLDFPVDTFSADITRVFEDIVSRDGLPVKKGVLEILNFLRESGSKIGLATSSGRKSTDKNLDRAGLSHFFDAIVTGDTIQRGKPDPEIYIAACQRISIPPQECFAIEDSPNGIKSASAAGLKTIMVPDLIEPSPSVKQLLFATFDSLLDVKIFMEKL